MLAPGSSSTNAMNPSGTAWNTAVNSTRAVTLPLWVMRKLGKGFWTIKGAPETGSRGGAQGPRSSRFSTLPVGLLGMESTSAMWRGTL